MNAELDFRSLSLELAVRAAGHGFPSLSTLSPPDGHRPVASTFRTSNIDFSFFLLDVTLTTTGELRLIEANGSNAALSSVTAGGDNARAHHMYSAFRAMPNYGNGVVLFAFQPGFLHIPEFFDRAGLFASLVQKDLGGRTYLRDTGQELGEESITVVCGAIPDIADNVGRDGNHLTYRGRPVVFGANPNLLPELARRGIIQPMGNGYDVDTTFYHEGVCLPLIHDKVAQQEVANGTGISPIATAEARNIDEAKDVIHRFHQRDKTAVGKMRAGSGGTGIEFFPPSIGSEGVERLLTCLIEDAQRKYGPEVHATLWPIQFFEFVESTHYDRHGNPHLWDLRVECLVSPGAVECVPCVIRLCPEPFDPQAFRRDGVVSNLSGRNPSLRFMRLPTAMRRSKPHSVLDEVGIDSQTLHHILESCARWCEAAGLRSSTRRDGSAPVDPYYDS